MSVLNQAANTGHLLLVLSVVLLAAAAGRFAARKARQPEVIGELTAGLLAGPLVIAVFGRDRFGALVPAGVLATLKLIGEVGLVLFLAGLIHKLRLQPLTRSRRTVAWIVAGAVLPAMATGALFAGGVLLNGSPAVRGTAPAPAFVLMLVVTLSVTAVPVLARILTDRGMFGAEVGQLALTSAIIIDAVAWLLLSVAIGLASGSLGRFLADMAILAGGAAVAFLLGLVLRTTAATRVCLRVPWFAGLLVAGTATAMALTMERLGLTAIIGAALAGLAIPMSGRWDAALTSVTRIGQVLVPVFFVVTGVTVLTKGFESASIALIGSAVLLGIVGKAGGGYLGARFGSLSIWDAGRTAALMNTRGLTELIVLQAGYSAGVLTAPLFLAMVVMALTTTAMTGPTLLLIDRVEMRHRGPVRAGRPPVVRPARE
jgi:Kef-type K+ transport system membrane component KefB